MKNSSWRLLAIFMALGVIGPMPARAQLLQGSITGNVVDSSGAAVVGARVLATEQQTNFTRETITNDQGGYNLLTMPPGTYRLTVSAPSFQTTNVTGITVSPEQITRQDLSLTVGQVTENIQVEADANVLQT